jgi:methionine--tRNA ligase beta chain
MIKNKAQEIFKDSLKKLNQMIFNLDRNLGLVSNVNTGNVFPIESNQIYLMSSSSNLINTTDKSTVSSEASSKKDKKVTKKAEEKPKEDLNLNLFNECDIRVGKVIELRNKENSEEIYLLKVDLGEVNLRNIGTGLRKHVPPEEIEGKQVLVFSNLKPKKLGEFVSEGMILCCYDEAETKFELPRPNQSKDYDSYL